MSTRLRRLTRPALLAACLVLSPAAARADEGITVSGTGEARAKPTSVELSANLGSEAELTADAVVKFNDARKKALAALGGLKMANLSVEPSGVSIAAAVDPAAANRGIGGGGGNAGPQKTRVAEDYKLVLKNVNGMKPQEVTDAVMKVIDTGRDSGLTVGPKTPTNYYEFQTMARDPAGYAIAQFCLDDATAAREQAVQAAMKDAQQKAERLAALAGVKLGPVIAVRDSTSTSDGQSLRQMAYEMATGNTPAVPTAKSGRMEDISVKATVTVQYQIAK